VSEAAIRWGAIGRRVGTIFLAVFVLLGATWVFGVRDDEVSGSGGGFDLTVQYAKTTRPGLDTPWSAKIHRAGGFEHPVELRTTAAYWKLFDENGYSPPPDAVRQDSKYLVMEFAKPLGDEIVVSFDGRVSPAVQGGVEAETAVLADGQVAVSVNYRTRVMP
jgi:hypothetical protein